jgi:hypothetical protein
MSKLQCSVLIVASVVATATAIHAGSPSTESKGVCKTEFPFEKGAHEFELDVGAFGSPWAEGDAKRPDMAFAIGELRSGWMLTDPRGDGFLRGNWEFLLTAFGGGVFDGPGDVLIGAEMLLRYNFVQPGARLVPFIHAGGGGVYSDAANDDRIQHLIGTDFSFILEGEIGLRWKLNERCAISCGLDYRHISNAGLSHHNAGVNALGGVIGISVFY